MAPRITVLRNSDLVLVVSNADPLVEEVIKIRSEGLTAGEDVTFRVETTVGKNLIQFHSFGHFKADQDGIVDLSRHAPLSGTYSGVDPMGLFWSMEEVYGQRRGTSISQGDSRKPLKLSLEFYKGFVDFNVSTESIPDIVKNSDLEGKVEINRHYLPKNVERHEIKSGRLRGTLFIPQSDNGPMTARVGNQRMLGNSMGTSQRGYQPMMGTEL